MNLPPTLTPSVLNHGANRLRAFVYDRYFETAGGGERSALDVALALHELGFEIALCCDQPLQMSLEEIVAPFGVPSNLGWKLLEFTSSEEMCQQVRTQKIDVFVNHTISSFIPNPAPIGIYMVMFPHNACPEFIGNLQSYSHLLCNSQFTCGYVKQRWSESLPTEVLVPPISRSHFETARDFDQKEKLIINIGRFNVFGHNKRQREAIESFRSLVDSGVIDTSWQLFVAGHVNHSTETDAYLAECQALCNNYNIKIQTNLPLNHLIDLYKRASYLWQFTGFGSDYGVNPDNCEHLGLVALDCFAYGTIPIVYQRSGMTSILDHGINGYVFRSLDDLASTMQFCSRNFGSSFHRQQHKSAQERAREFNFEHFTGRLASFVRKPPAQAVNS